MRRHPFILAFLFITCCLLFASPATAQLQQSGGAGSSLSGITLGGNALTARPTGELDVNLGRIAGNTISTGNGTAGAGVQRVSIASDNSPFSVNATLQAGANVIGITKTVPSNSCGTTVFNQAWVAVPISSAPVTGTTICKATIVFTNTNASPQTVSVTDGQGSPVTAIGPAFSIPPLSTVRFELEGALTTGIKWNAGGTGVTGSVVGYQ
jgi:hypothetical protein